MLARRRWGSRSGRIIPMRGYGCTHWRSGNGYPHSESERDTVLARWNEVAGFVFEAPETVGVFVLDTALCPYDGGLDALLREPLRTSVATVFRSWVA
jgi:hypothetical protein